MHPAKRRKRGGVKARERRERQADGGGGRTRAEFER
jgi:hypothetical protein